MKKWHLYPTISAPMPFQMALDEVLFRGIEANEFIPALGTPLLRFFYSPEPWTTVGYSHRENGDVFKASGAVKVCRRITGGGKVEHGNDLILSIIGRKNEDD